MLVNMGYTKFEITGKVWIPGAFVKYI